MRSGDAHGESAQPREAQVLSAQEEQIVRLARDGLSNPEISGQIFITADTVEWHLRKEFTRLGIRDSLASVQTLVRGPGAHWSGVGSPGHSRRQGLDALLRPRHPGTVSPRSRELRLVLVQVSGVAPRVVPACPWKAGSAPRSRSSRRTRSQLPPRTLPTALDGS
jgi:DNA-binding CsgD family transcriptional regulator